MRASTGWFAFLAIWVLAGSAAAAGTAKPVLVSANILCAPTLAMTSCQPTNQSLLQTEVALPGFRFGLMKMYSGGTYQTLIDIGTEFFSATNERILGSDFDGTVLCAGSANLFGVLKEAIAPPNGGHANLLMCQIIYACPKGSGTNVTGKEVYDVIDVHNDADANKTLTLKC